MTQPADPVPLLFAPNHTAAFAGQVAAALGVSLARSEEREFDGGEHKMRPLDDVEGRDVFVLQSVHGDATASANDRLCRLLFFIGALKDAGAARVTACVPYLAYARKDRRTQPRDPVTTRYVAALFEAVGTDRIVVLDIHNESAFDNAFRCPAVRLESAALLAARLLPQPTTRPLCVVSPDSGGIKRAERFRIALSERAGSEVSFAFVHKIRRQGVLSGGTLVGDVQGSDVVIVDDLIASGGTVLRAAQAARAAGAMSVRVAATHAAFTPAAMSLFVADEPDSVLVTDSIPLAPAFAGLPHGRLEVCSAAPLFADAIRALSMR